LEQSGEIDLVAFDAREHLPLLRRWFARHHVRRWWGDPEVNIADALKRPHGGDHALISVDGTPVGYICWQPYCKRDLETVGEDDVEQGSIDVDLLIGELSQIGHGVGPRALRLLLARLGEGPAVPFFGMCTSVENTRAIRAFEKAGFSRVREYDDPERGRCWFMVARPGRVTA
jgi:aminoglycoside 6'-N-acetyltransferase